MERKERDLQELQDKLILIYKYVSQEKMYEKFFFKDLKHQRPYRYRNEMIEELINMDDSLEFLKTCILEVEELKKENHKDEISFIDILDKQDTSSLRAKYGLSKFKDIQDLDLTELLKYF